jgi:hypothetical protein
VLSAYKEVIVSIKIRIWEYNFSEIAENTIDRKWKRVVFIGEKWEQCGT